MDHVRESGVSMTRRRRRRRAVVTISLIAVLLLGGFAYAAAYVQGWVGTTAPRPVASPTCQVVTVPVTALAPRSVQVNVYNATSRNGLAASVAKLLQSQGFKIVRINNDPIRRTIRGVGEVRHGPKGAAAAKLALTRLPGARMVVDKRTDATVDVVLGNTFKTLTTPRKVAPKPVKIAPVKPANGTAENVARPSPSHSC